VVERPGFLGALGALILFGCIAVDKPEGGRSAGGEDPRRLQEAPMSIRLFLAGDVMTGRGIDQILPHPCDPEIREPYMKSALGYVRLAEDASGRIPKPVHFAYIWGEALAELKRRKPDLRIINLETAVTTSDDFWDKGINYRMNPKNVPGLQAAGIDVCVLANNHTVDWGFGGLSETLDTLAKAGIRTAGAGRNRESAETPATVDVPGKGRVHVFSFGAETSGIPPGWAAAASTPGVDLLDDLSDRTARRIADRIARVKSPGDLVVASIHWGGNWGFGVAREESAFAHRLVDAAGVDLVHGHSSHHPKGIEVYRGKLILYGCGDFLNDYEGIGGYEEFRPGLGAMYLVDLDAATGRLIGLEMVPTRVRRFQIARAETNDVLWLADALTREGRPFGTHLAKGKAKALVLRWE
jgi:poly-gamma-glutamate synthesis protein (capsule biosynthesis protein)